MKDLLQGFKQTTKYWWTSLILGILAIGLGIVFIAAPYEALASLTFLFIIGFLASGIVEIAFAISNRKTIDSWGWALTSGIIDLLLGILLLSSPSVTLLILIYFTGFWIMFRSIWAMGSAFDLKRIGVSDWGWLLLFAILGVLFSFTFIFSPTFGAGFIVAFASIAFISYGVFRIYLSIRLRKINNEIEKIDKN